MAILLAVTLDAAQLPLYPELMSFSIPDLEMQLVFEALAPSAPAQEHLGQHYERFPEIQPEMTVWVEDGPSSSQPDDTADLPEAAPRPAASRAGPIAPLRYVVQPGENLATIAERFGVDIPTLAGSNELDDPDVVPVGSQLSVLPVRGLLYRLAEGDTLNQLAEKYELAVSEILKANALESSEVIAAGQQLVLPGARPLLVRAPPPAVAAAANEAVSDSVEELALADRLLVHPASTRSRQPPGGWVWPASGPITTYFGEVGWSSPRGHAGLDISAPWGAPVLAAASGQVLFAAPTGNGYGIQIIVVHKDGLQTLYAHLSRVLVEPGERVQKGELIGLVGSTGFSTGPHLHFELRLGGELHDPLKFLP